MANFMYTNAKKLMLTGAFDWVNDPVVIILIAAGQYVPSVNHATLLDIPASARVAVSSTLTGKSVSLNVVDADDYLFTYVAGPPVNSVILAVSSGVESTSWLICHLDSSIVGIPFSPSASAAQLIWNNGPNRIFAL
jgi:hypothetical protein